MNVGLYAWNEAANQDGLSSSDWGDVAVAALQGAVVGGLIGSGVGAAAGATLAMSAGLGAASSLVDDQVSNLITGNDYNAVTTTMGAAAGAITGYAGTGLSTGGRMLLSGVVEGSSDTFEGMIQGKDVDFGDFADNVAWNAAGELWSSAGKESTMNPLNPETLPMTEIQAEIWSNIIPPATLAPVQIGVNAVLDACGGLYCGGVTPIAQ
ncbi:MAG: hypothetical protein HND45_13910 [Chloroflexi bacterium]|nr:hypothetical protein [Chloroflexota bacterium]